MKGWEELRGMFRPESSDFKDSGMGGRRETETQSCRWGRDSAMGRENGCCYMSENSLWSLHSFPFLLYFPSIKKTKKVKTHSPKFSYHLIPTSPPAFVVLLKSVSRYFRKVWAFSFPWCAVLCLVTQLCPTLCNPMDCSPPGSSIHGDSPGKNSRVGCHALLQGIFPTQVSHVAGRFFTIWATRETPPQYSDI